MVRIRFQQNERPIGEILDIDRQRTVFGPKVRRRVMYQSTVERPDS